MVGFLLFGRVTLCPRGGCFVVVGIIVGIFYGIVFRIEITTRSVITFGARIRITIGIENTNRSKYTFFKEALSVNGLAGASRTKSDSKAWQQ